jgi:D-lactate dehydrogenase
MVLARANERSDAMRIVLFSVKPYDRVFFEQANAAVGHHLTFLDARLDRDTAGLCQGHEAVCAFVNDDLGADVLTLLAEAGVRVVALRCSGFNNVDLHAAERLGMQVVRVPAYSPFAVAEHTLALILALNRKVHRSYNRVREGNFALDGLLGFDIHGVHAGVIGTGRIGLNVIRLLHGFGCEVLAYDPYPNEEAEALGASYVALETLLAESKIITLHCPLSPHTYHLIDEAAIARMRDQVMLINTSRGALIDTRAAVAGLKSGKIGYLGLDVYEEEGDLFFEDLSGEVIQDDVFARLTTFPNVLITGHQAFFTREALHNIAETTLDNVRQLEQTGSCTNAVVAEQMTKSDKP